MAVYYVGLGGNDLNAGTTWATRLLTLNAAEDAHGGGTPKAAIAAGDTVYVAPGVYREMLTCDVSGAAGSPITYIGDVSGEHTDGVGGVVRITGSDNDQTAARANCIRDNGTQRNYRTFRGFTLDSTSGPGVSATAAGTNWILEDITVSNTVTYSIFVSGANQASWTIRRCTLGPQQYICEGLRFTHVAVVDNTSHIVENCIFNGPGYQQPALQSVRVGGITVRNCLFVQSYIGILIGAALSVGQTVTVNNCILYGCRNALQATALGELIENYNSISGCSAPRTNVAVGANSNTYPPLFDMGIFHAGASQVSGFRFPPPLFGALSQWSQVRAIADTGAATEDILGLTRPVTAGKRSWGAVQYVDMIRDATNPRTGTACKELQDAGREQIRVPTIAVSMVFSVWVYRGANYAGVNPQMIIKQPGQADVVITDAGAAGVYNLLTTTLTPAALPGYVVIELVSNNAAAAGAYGVYFDDLTALEA